MMNSRLYRLLFAGCLSSLLLISCTKDDSAYLYKPKTKLYPRRPNHSSDAAVIYYSEKLKVQHVDVITVGEGHLLVIPDKFLFADQSPQLTWRSYELLNQVIHYIKLYRTAEITINDFVLPYGSIERQQALSLARATAIKEYFWSQDIDSRLIVSIGQGSAKPARVEIRFFELLQ